MGAGAKVETRGHVVGFREEIDRAARTSEDGFFTWFNDSRDTETAFVRGNWDFMIHVAFPLAKYVSKPEELTALEIGHGGGRILAAACRSFRMVVGIDIHDHNQLVAKELRSRGVTNFEIHRTDGLTIPCGSDSVEVVYSFIVLQHVEKLSTLQKYFEEAYRVLKPGGLAILYFGRKCPLSHNTSSRSFHLIDRLLENLLLPRGFRELPSRVNHTNLVVSARFVKRLAKQIGFSVLKAVVSHKRVPDGIDLYGSQHGLILRKGRGEG